jgi:hypothetical protein
MEKIFFPEKSRKIEVMAFLSKTGSGRNTTSIFSGLRKKIGVVKRTIRPKIMSHPRNNQPTALK